MITWWWTWGAVLWHSRCSPRPTGGRSGPEPGDQDDDKERGCTVQSRVETLLWILQIYWSQDDEWCWISTSPSGQHWIMVHVLSSLHFGSKIMRMMYDITKMGKISNEWCMDLKKKKLWSFYHLVDTLNSDWQESFLESSSVKSSLPWVRNELHITQPYCQYQG